MTTGEIPADVVALAERCVAGVHDNKWCTRSAAIEHVAKLVLADRVAQANHAEAACRAARLAAIEECAGIAVDARVARLQDVEDWRQIEIPHTVSDAWEHAADEAGEIADAIRALATGGATTPSVTIKPLEWRQDDTRLWAQGHGNPQGAIYFSYGKNADGQWQSRHVSGPFGPFGSPDEVKDAVQAEYERRIKAALADFPATLPTGGNDGRW